MSTYVRPRDLLEDVDAVRRAVRRSSLTLDKRDPDERPGKVTNVGLTFHIREKKAFLNFTGRVTWDPVPANSCSVELAGYEIQLRPCLPNGNVIENFRRYREFVWLKDVEDAGELDDMKVEFPWLEHPKKWCWQARVRVFTKDNVPGLWSDWTDVEGPPFWDATPVPPTPENLYLTAKKNADDRQEPRWQIKAECDEVGPWDIPPTGPNEDDQDEEDDVEFYEFLIRRCNAAGVFLTYVDDQGRTRYRQRKHIVKAKDQDDNQYASYWFNNVFRKHRYKGKVRCIGKYNHWKSDWSAWTDECSGLGSDDFVPMVKHPLTGVSGDFVADLDQHLLTLWYDYPEDPDDTDNDLKDPDRDVVGVQIQVSDRADFDRGLSNVWVHDRFYAGEKWKTNIKKPSGTLHIRVRCVNSSGSKGNWATETVQTKIPPVPDTLVTVTVGKMKANKHNKWYAKGEFIYNEAGYNEDHIGTWVLLMQTNNVQGGHTAGAGWGNDPEKKHVFKEKEKRSGDNKHAFMFTKLTAKDWISMAFYVVDKQGRASPISNWSAPQKLSTATKPQKPTNVERIAKPRKVGIKGHRPMDLDDATISDTNIVEYRVQRSTNSTFTAIVDDLRVENPKMTWDLAPTNKTQYWMRMASVDEEGQQSNYVHDDGTESPPPSGAVAPDLDLNDPDIVGILPVDQLPTIPYGNFGTLGVSRYGSTTAMNAASAKDGDIWLNTDYSPARPFYRRSGAWNASVDGAVLLAGTVLADAVVAGAIDGIVITGATVQTRGTGNRRVMLAGGSFADGIFWITAGETTEGSITHDGNVMRIRNFDIDGDLEITTDTGMICLNGQVRFDEYNASPGVIHNTGTADNVPVGGAGNLRPHQWFRFKRTSDSAEYYIPGWKVS